MKKPEYCTNEVFNFLDELEKSRKIFNEFSHFSGKLEKEFNLSPKESCTCFSYWFLLNKNKIKQDRDDKK